MYFLTVYCFVVKAVCDPFFCETRCTNKAYLLTCTYLLIWFSLRKQIFVFLQNVKVFIKYGAPQATSLSHTTVSHVTWHWYCLMTINHHEHLFSVAWKSRLAPSLWLAHQLNHQMFANQVNNTLLWNFSSWLQIFLTPSDTDTSFIFKLRVCAHTKE